MLNKSFFINNFASLTSLICDDSLLSALEGTKPTLKLVVKYKSNDKKYCLAMIKLLFMRRRMVETNQNILQTFSLTIHF